MSTHGSSARRSRSRPRDREVSHSPSIPTRLARHFRECPDTENEPGMMAFYCPCHDHRSDKGVVMLTCRNCGLLLFRGLKGDCPHKGVAVAPEGELAALGALDATEWRVQQTPFYQTRPPNDKRTNP